MYFGNLYQLLRQILKTQVKCCIMQYYAAFHLGLHCLLRQEQYSWTEVLLIWKIYIVTCDPLKCIMSNPRFIESDQLEEFINVQRVNNQDRLLFKYT